MTPHMLPSGICFSSCVLVAEGAHFARHRLESTGTKICRFVIILVGSSGSGVASGFASARMADADDSAEWVREMIGFSSPAASVQVDDSAEWLRELVGFSVPAPSVQVDDSMEWLHELLGFSSVPAPSAPSAPLSSLEPAAVPASSSVWQPRRITPRAGPAPRRLGVRGAEVLAVLVQARGMFCSQPSSCSRLAGRPRSGSILLRVWFLLSLGARLICHNKAISFGLFCATCQT